MIVVPKPIPVPHYHPASASAAARNNSLRTPSFQSGRLARARPAAPTPIPIPIYPSYPVTATSTTTTTTISTPAPPPTPSPKQQAPRNRRRKSPQRQPQQQATSTRPSHSHTQSLHGLGGDMDLVLDYSDFSRVTPPLTPPPLHTQPQQQQRYNSFPSFPSPSPSPTSRPFYTPSPSYKGSHIRSPSVPIFSGGPASFPGASFSISPSSSLGGERYANSNFQNSPPPRNLPKPSFLLSSKSVPSTSTSTFLNDDDPFI